jgi:hypothetical protein
MDDFRVGSVPPYDPIDHQRTDDSARRKKRKHSDESGAPEEDVFTLSEHTGDDEEPAVGYAPRREQP